jgi:hypothetical protein
MDIGGFKPTYTNPMRLDLKYPPTARGGIGTTVREINTGEFHHWVRVQTRNLSYRKVATPAKETARLNGYQVVSGYAPRN